MLSTYSEKVAQQSVWEISYLLFYSLKHAKSRLRKKVDQPSQFVRISPIRLFEKCAGCHAHIAKQGEHAWVEVEDHTRMLALLRDANMAPNFEKETHVWLAVDQRKPSEQAMLKSKSTLFIIQRLHQGILLLRNPDNKVVWPTR